MSLLSIKELHLQKIVHVPLDSISYVRLLEGEYIVGCPPLPVTVANEGLGWDSRAYKCNNPGVDGVDWYPGRGDNPKYIQKALLDSRGSQGYPHSQGLWALCQPWIHPPKKNANVPPEKVTPFQKEMNHPNPIIDFQGICWFSCVCLR